MQPSLFPKIVVGVLIYDDEKNIFLAKSYKWKNKWIVPGGHLEFGETLEQCAKREVKEETNLDVDCVELIDVQESIFSEEFHDKRHMIFLDYSAKATSKDVILNDELQEFMWVRPLEALKLDLNVSTKRFIQKFMQK